MASSFRLSERFEGVQWLGKATPKDDVDWLTHLPSGPSNVKTVEFLGDRFRLTTHLTESLAEVGDYIVFGNNRQPMVMPAKVFEARYEKVDGELDGAIQ